MTKPIRKGRTRADLVKMLETQGRLLVQLAEAVKVAEKPLDLCATDHGLRLVLMANNVLQLAGLLPADAEPVDVRGLKKRSAADLTKRAQRQIAALRGD